MIWQRYSGWCTDITVQMKRTEMHLNGSSGQRSLLHRRKRKKGENMNDFEEQEVNKLLEINKRQREYINFLHGTLLRMCILFALLVVMWVVLAFCLV